MLTQPGAPSTIVFNDPDPIAGHCLPTPPQETPKHTQASLAHSPVGSLLLSPRSWCAQGPVWAPKSLFPPVLGNFCNQISLASTVKFPGGSQTFSGSPGWEIHCGSLNYHQMVNTKMRLIIFFEAKKSSISEVTQSCLTLCDPVSYSLPGSSIHGIFQARILKWVAISFSRRSSQPRDWTQVFPIKGRCFTLWATGEVQRSWIHSAKPRLGADCGSDHEHLIAKIRLKLKKVGRSTRPFSYNLKSNPFWLSSGSDKYIQGIISEF